MKLSKKKILVLASTFPRWDGDTTPPFVFELEKRLAKGFDIHVLAPHSKGAKKKEITDNLNIHRFQYFWPEKYQHLCYEGGILPKIKQHKVLAVQGITLVMFEFIAALQLIRKEKINLIHAHWIIPQGIVAWMINKLFHIPYIITTHGGDIYGLQNKVMIHVKKMILNNAKMITVVSNDIKNEILTKINPDLNIQVVSMGVDSKLFNPHQFDKTIKDQYNISGPFLLFVGRLAEKKGVRYLIEAMPDIIKHFPETKLLIVGNGTLEEELKTLTRELKLDNNIIFTGAIPNHILPKFYATADIFIGPSIKTKDGDTEGLGLTFIEASFSGCIPIGTNIGGISDAIQDGVTGFIVKEKDPQSIKNTVIEILSNKNLKDKIKEQTIKETLYKFDWEIINNRYYQIYQ